MPLNYSGLVESQHSTNTQAAERAIQIRVGHEVRHPHQHLPEYPMPKDAHNKAAEHHEHAAKSHRAAAEQHGKSDHAKGKEHSTNAQQHSQNARQQSEQAHTKSQQQK
jgi:hypothetical protein